MKKNLKLNKDELVAVYYENKELLIPIFAIGVSVLLFLFFIFPQVLSFPSRKSQVDLEQNKLNKIKESEKVLSTINSEELDLWAKIASDALPENKPLEEALLAISTAANLSGVQIESYAFQDSSLVSSEDESIQASANRQQIIFSIKIYGEIEQAADFVDKLYLTYPISWINNISTSEGLAQVSVKFFYSPFLLGSLEDRTVVRLPEGAEKNALDKILKWNQVVGGDTVNVVPKATESADTTEQPL